MTMKMTRSQLFAALMMITLLVATGTGFAQQGGAGAAGGGYQAPPSAPMNVDDNTVSRFADAFLAVQEISDDLTEKMAEAENAESAQSMQSEARQDMAQAVEDNGISVKQYNDIASGMQRNPQLAERVQAAIEEAR
ncbi:MAG: DUF4168 domain-containing protein [Gammaproteobacteria bacterium]|jgi:hypothetical protein|nr:DUF4168 domain-containing protein [Gammaproteobacteria bacterium]